MDQYRTMAWPRFGRVIVLSLACFGFLPTTVGAGLVVSVASQTFTPKSGTTRAKLEQTLLAKDDLPNDAAVKSWSTATTNELSDFLNEGGGNYFLDVTLHVRNQIGAAPPGLGFRLVGVQLLDVAGLPLNGSDQLFFGAGSNIESTSFFTNPPAGADTPSEVLTWSNGLLPSLAPFTEATFKMVIHLDATENFGGNGKGTFSLDTALEVQTVPEPSSIILAILSMAGGACLLRTKAFEGTPGH